MKYRVKEYTIDGLMIILPYEITIEDLCKLTNETLEITLCSSMFKNKALVKKNLIWTEVPNAVSISGNVITVNQEACILQSTDKLTIEIDKGDSSLELAKLGENQEATNSKIYDAVKAIPDLSLLYAARAEKNDDGVNTYSIILPVTAKVIYDDNEVATIQL